MGSLHITAEDQRLKNRIANAVEEAWFSNNFGVYVTVANQTFHIRREADNLVVGYCTGDEVKKAEFPQADAPAAILKLLQG